MLKITASHKQLSCKPAQPHQKFIDRLQHQQQLSYFNITDNLNDRNVTGG